jgi:hypothetical protein
VHGFAVKNVAPIIFWHFLVSSVHVAHHAMRNVL